MTIISCNKTAIGLCLLLFLSGCTVPGSRVDVSNKKIVQTTSTSDSGAMLDDVAVYPITPEFIVRLRAAEASRHSASNRVASSAMTTNTSNYQYRINIGDVLQIVIWNHPELMSPAKGSSGGVNARVDANGRVYFPFVGEVAVAGKPIKAIRDLITRRLAQFIHNPQVDVSVAAYESQKVYVSGEVNKPGVYAITHAPLTVLDVINLAGGITDSAQWDAATLNRDGKEIVISLQELLQNGALSQNYLLAHGDALHVPRGDNNKVYVMGEVVSAKTVDIGRYGITLTKAISDAGGLNENKSNATGVFVIRSRSVGLLPNQNKQKKPAIADIYQLDLSDATALALGTEFDLRAGDVVYVTATPVARWNRVLSNIMPSVAGLSSIKNLVQ